MYVPVPAKEPGDEVDACVRGEGSNVGARQERDADGVRRHVENAQRVPDGFPKRVVIQQRREHVVAHPGRLDMNVPAPIEPDAAARHKEGLLAVELVPAGHGVDSPRLRFAQLLDRGANVIGNTTPGGQVGPRTPSTIEPGHASEVIGGDLDAWKKGAALEPTLNVVDPRRGEAVVTVHVLDDLGGEVRQLGVAQVEGALPDLVDGLVRLVVVALGDELLPEARGGSRKLSILDVGLARDGGDSFQFMGFEHVQARLEVQLGEQSRHGWPCARDRRDPS